MTARPDIARSQLRWIRAVAISWFVILALFGGMYVENRLEDRTAQQKIERANRPPDPDCIAGGYADALCRDPNWKRLTGR